MNEPTIPLSVVIACSQPWPEIRGALESVYAQTVAVRGELVIADATACGFPEKCFPQARRLHIPGAHVFQLRAAGVAAARGDVVAVTEDHCRVAPDWCEKVLRAHREWPQAAAIAGTVENGATEALADWANFFITNGPYLNPLPSGERDQIGGQANISYKGRVLPAAFPPVGLIEGEFTQALRTGGETLVNDGRLVVHHVQALGLWGGCLLHYHDGRSTAGLARDHLSRRAWTTKLGRALLLPLRVPVEAARFSLRVAWRKPGHARRAIAAMPLIAVILCFHIAGELVGLIAGPGRSPWQLR